MAELVLGPMLRYVSETSATIWVETDNRCVVGVLDREVPTFCVAGHHYALVVIDSLEPNTSTEYSVTLDGEVHWPLAGSSLPASRIATLGGRTAPRIVFGSCRTAAPHEPPWTLTLALDPKGRGVDALYTFALAMLSQTPDEWPQLAVFLGDQIYGDDFSPQAGARIAESRTQRDSKHNNSLPKGLAAGFEQYTWLYHESWSPEIERWFFSNVPSVMIFDDHEMIDDWNISDVWLRDIRKQSWWEGHVTGGLMTYWLYQHLGNLSPETIEEEGLVAALTRVDDGEAILREWARRADHFTPLSGEYRFSFVRDIQRVRVIVIDSRNARVLEPGNRQMVDADHWQWVTDACNVDVDHLVIGSSLPVFVPSGMHDLQVWNERICDGKWGRVGRKFGEWLRQKADVEDWSAFSKSFTSMVELIEQLGAASRTKAPSTISVIAGDIHFSYVAEIRFPPHAEMRTRVHQMVSSPIRNTLKSPESTAMRLAASHFASLVGRALRRGVGRRRPTVKWKVDHGPLFANALSQLTFVGRAAELVVLQASAHNDTKPPTLERAIIVDLAQID